MKLLLTQLGLDPRRDLFLLATTTAACFLVTWTLLFQSRIAVLSLFALFAALASLFRWSYTGVFVAFIWSTSLVHLFKRAIFLFGSGSQFLYYGIQILPACLLVLLILWRRAQSPARVTPPGGPWILAWAAWAVFNTLFLSAGAPGFARIAALHDRTVPILLFFLAASLPHTSLTSIRILRALVISASVTVSYALVQFVNGPTLLDRRWAEATADFSIQGQKTFLFIEGVLQDWRAYSYFADPLTWGLFLFAAIVALWLLRFHRAVSHRTTICFTLFLVVGLIVCLTRTPWVALLALLAVFFLLARRIMQRPAALILLLVVAFVALLGVGTLLYESAFRAFQITDSQFLQRYLAIGSVEARLGAWESLKNALSQSWLFGIGYGYEQYYMERVTGVDPGDVGGHNFLVELIVHTGLPGLLLFLTFLWTIFREGAAWLRSSPPQQDAAPRLLLAALLAFVITGYLNGGSFINYYFYLFAGLLVGEVTRAQRRTQHVL